MIDISRYAGPRQPQNAGDGIEILEDAGLALDVIGKKLEIMRKLASYAADPGCDQLKRMELNLLFKKLAAEIDDWAHTSTGGVQLLNGPCHMAENAMN